MYHASAQGVDERMINGHYYYHRVSKQKPRLKSPVGSCFWFNSTELHGCDNRAGITVKNMYKSHLLTINLKYLYHQY